MTRTQLEELAKRLDEHWNASELMKEAAALLRSLLAQEPVAWMHYYSKPGKGYSCADIGEHGPDPDEGFVHKGKEPLYAAPVPPVDPEWKAEAMRLADEYAGALQFAGFDGTAEQAEEVNTARAALAAHLDKLGRK